MGKETDKRILYDHTECCDENIKKHIFLVTSGFAGLLTSKDKTKIYMNQFFLGFLEAVVTPLL